MKKNKTLLISGISAIVIAAILFFTNKCDNTPTIDLNEAFAALELTNDSLQQEVVTLATANEHLMVENKELEELNAQLSKLAQKKQKVRTITRTVLTTEAKRTITAQEDSLNLYKRKLLSRKQQLDSFVAIANSLATDPRVVNPVAMQEEINALQEALSFCLSQEPAYQNTFQDSFLYLRVLTYPDSMKFQLGHEDVLTAYQTEQRNGFLGLGKKTYQTYVTSASPYSNVKDMKVFQRTERSKPFAIGLHIGFGPTWQPWDDANNFQFSTDDVHLGIQAGLSLQYRLIKF